MQDGGGSIDSKELKDLMASVGQNPTDDELAEMIRIADADGTGAPRTQENNKMAGCGPRAVVSRDHSACMHAVRRQFARAL